MVAKCGGRVGSGGFLPSVWWRRGLEGALGKVECDFRGQQGDCAFSSAGCAADDCSVRANDSGIVEQHGVEGAIAGGSKREGG